MAFEGWWRTVSLVARPTAQEAKQTLKRLSGSLEDLPPNRLQRSSWLTKNPPIPVLPASTRNFPMALWLREHRARVRDLFAAELAVGIGKNVQHTASLG